MLLVVLENPTVGGIKEPVAMRYLNYSVVTAREILGQRKWRSPSSPE